MTLLVHSVSHESIVSRDSTWGRLNKTGIARFAASAPPVKMFSPLALLQHLLCGGGFEASAFDVDMSSQTHAVSTRMLCVDGKMATEE